MLSIHFHGIDGTGAIDVYETTVGVDFVTLARKIYNQNIDLSIITCVLNERIEKDLNDLPDQLPALHLTEEQEVECGKLPGFRKNYYRCDLPWGVTRDGGGFFNDCISPYPMAIFDSSGIVTSIYPVWKIEWDKIWLKWKAYGFI